MNMVVETIARAYRNVHQQLREMVTAADAPALHWVPADQANPVAVLVIHTLGSEAEVWRLVAGIGSTRDRDAEFVPTTVTGRDLLDRLDAADLLLDDVAPRVSEQDLARVRERSGRSPQTALHWLITNYGHAREHLAHAELTLQLYGQG